MTLSCQTQIQGQLKSPYPFVNHDNMEVFDLSQELLEISGLVSVGSAFLAIQDEAGILYSLNPTDFTIVERETFAWPGDYEAITHVGDSLWVVDSRGILYEMSRKNDISSLNSIMQLPDSKKDYEGVWKDMKDEFLYLICRKANRGKKSLTERYIWVFNPEKEVFVDSLKIPMEDIWNYLLDFGNSANWSTPLDRNLAFSDLTRDAITNNWLLLNNSPASVIILNSDAKLLGIIELDNKVLPQPEALCFDQLNNLIIASEGILGPARIVRFRNSNLH